MSNLLHKELMSREYIIVYMFNVIIVRLYRKLPLFMLHQEINLCILPFVVLQQEIKMYK